MGFVLGEYKNTMTSDGYEAKNVDLMGLSDLEKTISAHGKKSVLYSDRWNNKQEEDGRGVLLSYRIMCQSVILGYIHQRIG